MSIFFHIHEILSLRIIEFLDYIYYNNLKILYKNSLKNLFYFSNNPILKPEFLLYLQFFFIYKFLCYENFFLVSFYLHFTHICKLVFDKLTIKYDYIPIKNVNILKESSFFLFLYFLFIKILYINTDLLNKLTSIFILFIFFILMNINFIYKERLKHIKLNKDFRHILKIFIISPSKPFIESVIKNTNYFSYENFLYLINFFIYILK
jgi:hypothetical protein